jgi:hypothetical protein
MFAGVGDVDAVARVTLGVELGLTAIAGVVCVVVAVVCSCWLKNRERSQVNQEVSVMYGWFVEEEELE